MRARNECNLVQYIEFRQKKLLRIHRKEMREVYERKKYMQNGDTKNKGSL